MSIDHDADVVSTTAANRVLTITINRPQSRNAINRQVAHAIAAGLDQLENTAELAVGILTGAGGTFCAGMDLKAFPSEGIPIVGDRGLAGLTRATRTKPLIAAVEGHAMAGGCELALACDLIVAAETAVFGLPEVRQGLCASEGGAIRLPKRIPYHVAMHMLLTGEPIDAVTAYRHGLVSRLVPTGQALTSATELAQAVIANAPLATAATLRIATATVHLDDAESFAYQDPPAHHVATSHDAREGAEAFADKRAVHWQGR